MNFPINTSQNLQSMTPYFLSKTHFSFPSLSSPFNNRRYTITTAAHSSPKPRILIAGGGIGGLTLAIAGKNRGFEVLVFEKDLSAVRGEGKYRGPIQLQSNALAALEAIDADVAEKIMNLGCVTGNRVNGLVDGISGNWYVKFDIFTPAVKKGLPVTRVISRMTLQEILANALSDKIIRNNSNVVNFVDHGNKVTAMLENGEKFEGDLLVGADGIWSKIRRILHGSKDASNYSGYTCYTGIADYLPEDIETIGYRVFLGHKQYFVSSDVGNGKMQWYAFHYEPAGGTDFHNDKKERVLEIFEGWCENVIDLIKQTNENAIMRRDIYDITPTKTWGKGRVTLLGDSIHAMQPNLGQGGCMAIEDSYQLALELDEAWLKSTKEGTPVDIVSSLKRYEEERWLRVATIHGMSRSAADMATTYRPYLGVGLGPLSFLTRLKIPHPGKFGGRLLIKFVMPLILSWILGGYSSKLEGRPLSCRLCDKANDKLKIWFKDDDALEQALNGEWYLMPVNSASNYANRPLHLIKDENRPISIGNISQSNMNLSLSLPSCQVSENHAYITCKNNLFYLTDLKSKYGTWITNNEGRRYRVFPNFPIRFHPSNIIEFGSDKKAMFRVKVLKSIPETITNEIKSDVY